MHDLLSSTEGLRLHMAPKAVLQDVFSESHSLAPSTGFVLSRIAGRSGPVLWVQDRMSISEAGRPSVPGLRDELGAQTPILHVQANRPRDVLWAMEEGLRCAGLAAVIGEVWGDPGALDFTATKRLGLRAEAQGVPAFLIRAGAPPGLSAARERWQVGARPSAANRFDTNAPGDPRWRVDLFRSRSQAPGTWEALYDRKTHRLHLSAPLCDGTVSASDQKQRRVG